MGKDDRSLPGNPDRKNKLSLQECFENISTGLFISSTEGVLQDVNKAFCRLTGYTRKALQGKSFRDLTHPDDVSLDLEDLELAAAGKIDRYWAEKRYIRKDGSEIRVSQTVSLIRDTNDAPSGFFCTIDEIPRRKQTKTEPTGLTENWHRIIQALNHPTVILDQNYSIVEVNDAVVHASGTTRAKLIGTPCYKLFYGKDQEHPPSGCLLEKSLKEVNTEAFETEIEAFDGTYLVSCTPIPGEEAPPGYFIIVATDITKLKQIERELNESESRYRQLVDVAPVGFAVIVGNKIAFGNAMCCKIMGMEDPDRLAGMDMSEFLFPDSLEDAGNRIQRLLAGERNLFPVEDKSIRADGKIIDVQVVAETIKYQGQPAVMVIIQDITERKKALEKLVESDRRFTEMMNSVHLLAVMLDTSGNILFCNPFLRELTGYSQEEVIGRNWFRLFVPPEGTDELLKVFAQMMEDGKYEKYYENEIVTKGGERLLIAWNNSLLRDTDGKIIGTSSIGENITERKLAEKELKRMETILKETERIAKIGGWEFDVSTMKGTWTDETARIHELPPSENVIVETGLSFYREESKKKIEKAVGDAIEKGIPYDLELEMITAKGTRKWVRTIAQVVKKDNEVIKVFGSIQDITARVLINRELVKAKEKAEESDKLKSAFLANMSHEIRTPMNGILGFASLLKNPELTGKKANEYIDLIHQSGERMLNIINDLISISKIEAGQMQVNKDAVSVSGLLNELYLFFKPEAERKNIRLVSENQVSEDDDMISTDKTKIHIVLSYLIKNALKFTHSGSISLKCKRKGDLLEFSVKDTGIGIPSDMRESVFERFRQVDTTMHSEYEGAGLGLSISKAYIEMLGGKIWVDSKPEKGSTFYFTLPYKGSAGVTADENGMPGQIESESGSSTILIAEDDVSCQVLLREILGELGFSVLIAENGLEALETIKRHPEIEMVLLDIKMPVMDGFDAITQIRSIRPDLTIIAQTAYAYEEDREKILSTGCNDYISKPIRKEELYSLIRKYIRHD